MSPRLFPVTSDLAGQTIAAVLRRHLPDKSWADIRRLVQSRRVRINGELWLDSARRLKEGDTLELLERPLPRARLEIPVRYLDEHVVVVEKPAGIPTVRHPAERDWPRHRKELVPTLEDLVVAQIQQSPRRRESAHRLRIVQRLDKETSGLVVFARSVLAERVLGKQFREHTVLRRYLAIVPGMVKSQTVRSFLIRDRGDGRRGSTTNPKLGKEAVTHLEALDKLSDYTLLSCRLETGRTHQIRIHLAELGHAVCGDPVYQPRIGGKAVDDLSGAPRLALHAAELGFEHPVTSEKLLYKMPLPPDLQAFLDGLRLPPA